MTKIRALFSKMFKNKRVLMALSLVMSFVCWLVITNNSTKISTRNITVPINMSNYSTSLIELYGLEFVAENDLKVTVNVSGASTVISSLNESDIVITPDVSGITEAGTYNIDLVASKASRFSGFSINSVEPSSISVLVDSVITKSFTATPKVSGVSASDGLILGTFSFVDESNSTLNVKGPKTVIDTIDSAVVFGKLNKVLSESTTVSCDVLLLDKNGKKIDDSYLTLSYEKADVSVPIYMQKTVKINAQKSFINAPASVTAKLTLSEDSIAIMGPPDIVASLKELTLSEIDFSTISNKKKTFDCSIDFPSSVKAVDGKTMISVTVDASGLSTKTLSVSNINFTNIPNGKTASLNKSLSVVLVGSKNEISKIKSSDVTLIANLSGYDTTGIQMIPVTVSVSGYKTVWAYYSDGKTQYSASIKLS